MDYFDIMDKLIECDFNKSVVIYINNSIYNFKYLIYCYDINKKIIINTSEKFNYIYCLEEFLKTIIIPEINDDDDCPIFVKIKNNIYPIKNITDDEICIYIHI